MISGAILQGLDGIAYTEKVPDDSLDYSINWNGSLQTNETILVSSWTLDTGLVAGITANSAGFTTQWISGGVAGTSYYVTNEITTSAGRIFERAFRVDVVTRLS